MRPSLRQFRRTVARWLGATPVSTQYEILQGPLPPDIRDGWQNPNLPERQWAAFGPVLTNMRSGKYREDFIALAQAVKYTALNDPLVVEIGCGSGWNAEVLKRILGYPVRYIGADYSLGMVHHGKRHYPDASFLACDAAKLPFADASCDILLSGTALMHILEYQNAIAESRRVARRFGIFHTVTVHTHRATTMLRKLAYGERVVELVYNESELIDVFRKSGFQLRHSVRSIPYDLFEVTGEHSVTKTYVCEAV